MQRELSERSQACLREGGAEAVCYKFEEYHLHRAGISPSVLSCTDQEREQRTWLDLQLWLKEEGERVRELWIQAGGGWSSAQDFSLCGNRKAKCKEMKKKRKMPRSEVTKIIFMREEMEEAVDRGCDPVMERYWIPWCKVTYCKDITTN